MFFFVWLRFELFPFGRFPFSRFPCTPNVRAPSRSYPCFSAFPHACACSYCFAFSRTPCFSVLPPASPCSLLVRTVRTPVSRPYRPQVLQFALCVVPIVLQSFQGIRSILIQFSTDERKDYLKLDSEFCCVFLTLLKF